MRYALMREMDVSNGEGLGVSLFVQGCPHHCYKCFNPETWDFDEGKVWTTDAECIFLELIDRPFISRVSILGGEPLCKENIVYVYVLLDRIRTRFPNKKIWLYTGSVLEKENFHWDEKTETKEQAILHYTLSLCDYVVDGPYVDSLRDLTLAFRGSSNQRIIDVRKTIENGEIITYDI